MTLDEVNCRGFLELSISVSSRADKHRSVTSLVPFEVRLRGSYKHADLIKTRSGPYIDMASCLESVVVILANKACKNSSAEDAYQPLARAVQHNKSIFPSSPHQLRSTSAAINSKLSWGLIFQVVSAFATPGDGLRSAAL